MPRVALYSSIAVILAISIFPFWWMVDTSFKQPVDIFGGVTFYPHHPTTSNYHRLFNTYHFASYLENSLIIVAVAVVCQPGDRHARGVLVDAVQPALRPQPVGARRRAARAHDPRASCS